MFRLFSHALFGAHAEALDLNNEHGRCKDIVLLLIQHMKTYVFFIKIWMVVFFEKGPEKPVLDLGLIGSVWVTGGRVQMGI
jgi:hypothetical protein